MKPFAVVLALAIASSGANAASLDAQIGSVAQAAEVQDSIARDDYLAQRAKTERREAKDEAYADANRDINLESRRIDLDVQRKVANRTDDIVNAEIRRSDNVSKQRAPNTLLYIR